jgi:pseudaminic acid synthase
MAKRTYIIAELSANHNNDFKLAKDTITAIKESGADAVKFQTYTADSLSLDVDNEIFGPRKDGLWKGLRPYDLFKEASMPYEWQSELSEYAKKLGLDWLSSPFDFEAVDFLESIKCPTYKIASLEIVDIPLIKYAARKGKPIIISTGISRLADIELAVDTCRSMGNNNISLLKCTSAYPSPYEEINLKTIPHMKDTFGLPVGLSDHTLGSRKRGRSLFAVKDIKKGEKLTSENIRSVRPGLGLHPKHYEQVVNKVVKLDIKKGTPLSWGLICE